MNHCCDWLKKYGNIDEFHLTTVEHVNGKWVLHKLLRANEKRVYDGEASYVGEIIHDHVIPINFCPKCGEKLTNEIENSHTDNHKQHAPEPKYPELSPDHFFQCPEIGQLNSSLQDAGIGNRWFIVQDPEGWWMLEKFRLATEEMVANHDVENLDELYFLSGYDIIFCPFCGELLSPERITSNSSVP
jgi:hypothetical protein